MCLIVRKDPGVQLDENKIEQGVLNNPHGWGFVVPRDNKIFTRRFFNEEGTKPDDVLKFLEEMKEEKAYIHLRFATTGSKSKKHTHPFQSLTKRKHGVQTYLMHNGTMYGYSSKEQDVSDTKGFNNNFLTPLLERFVSFTGPEGLLSDHILKQVLEENASYNSVLTIIDSFGNDLIINEDKGTTFKDEEGKEWWVSNTYSFRENYRAPNNIKVYTPNTLEKTTTYEEYNQSSFSSFVDDLQPYGQNTTATILSDYKDMGIEEADSIAEIWGLQNLSDFCMLGEQDIKDIVLDYPHAATQLIVNLLHELYEKVNVD